jgi:hypothetical protein
MGASLVEFLHKLFFLDHMLPPAPEYGL